MADSQGSLIDPWHVLLDHPVAVACVVVSLAALLIVILLRGPITRVIDSLARRGGRLPGGIELNPADSAQKQTDALQATEEGRTFDRVTQALLGPVIEERTRSIETDLRALPAAEEQRRALLVLAAREQIVSEFHRLYRVIYGSQITALKGSNIVGAVSRAALQDTYTSAAARDPEFFKVVPFDHWLGFLIAQLLLREDGGRYHITNRGQLFLHFLVQEGLSDYGLPHNSRR